MTAVMRDSSDGLSGFCVFADIEELEEFEARPVHELAPLGDWESVTETDESERMCSVQELIYKDWREEL